MEALADMSVQGEWESLLAALQRNDESVNSVDAVDSLFLLNCLPSGYGRSLGNALAFNTSVTSLTLSVYILVKENADTIETDDFASLVNYVATSPVLHTVVCETYLSTSPESICLIFADHLLRAVGSNIHIRSLRFDRGMVYEPQHMTGFLNQTTSLKELELSISGDFLSDQQLQLAVVGALTNNAHITHLTLHFGFDDDAAAYTRVLEVLRQNVTLQKLDLTFGYPDVVVPGHVWSLLLGSGIPLRGLGLTSAKFDLDSTQQLLNGLISRGTVLDLKLDMCSFDNRALDQLADFLPVSPLRHLAIRLLSRPACVLLRQLAMTLPTRMESLDLLYLDGEIVVPLVTFLKSAVHLKELLVDSSWLEANERATLENGLRGNGSLVAVGEGLRDVYCRRNTSLRLLLGQNPLPPADVLLVPKLFRAAMAAEKMAPTMIFMGLLGCDRLATGWRRVGVVCGRSLESAVHRLYGNQLPLSEFLRTLCLATTLFFMIGGYWLMRSLKDLVLTALCGVWRAITVKSEQGWLWTSNARHGEGQSRR
jgi:hypothetical protein